MKPARLLLFAAAALFSLVLAYIARDLVHQLIVVPLVFLAWQAMLLAGTVPELVRWVVLTVILGLVIASQLAPELRSASRAPVPPRAAVGSVETVAIWLRRARSSNYFRWQLAHRLGRVARQWQDLAGSPVESGGLEPGIDAYLSAGSNHSFVDFPPRRGIFGRRLSSALDLDVAQVIDYLESRAFPHQENHGHRL